MTSTGAARARDAAQAVTEISDDEFTLFQALICREAGIHLSSSKKPMLVSRLMRRVNALKLQSFGDYYRHVIHDRQGEMVRLLDAVSTNETWFFRNPRHFSFVKNRLCPAWFAEAEAGRRAKAVTAWCSSSTWHRLFVAVATGSSTMRPWPTAMR